MPAPLSYCDQVTLVFADADYSVTANRLRLSMASELYWMFEVPPPEVSKDGA
jgi:hypothetical protein